MQINDIETLMRQMRQNGLTRLELVDDQFRLLLERSEPLLNASETPQAHQTIHPEHQEAEKVETDPPLPGVVVTSPVVGIYYSAANPDSDPFVTIGMTVEKGTTLCIIEAMKLMNEVTSDYQGTILDILVENGQRVEYGQPLMRIGDI